jgi:glycosyltransferase involved in cell wall biosynthesis
MAHVSKSSASSHPGQRLRVAIDARLNPGQGCGGIESVLIGLVHALGQLEDGNEEYVIIGPSDEPYWLKSYIGPNQSIVAFPAPAPPPKQKIETAKRALGPLRPVARRLWQAATVPQSPASRWPEVPISDGFHEGLNCEVVHFPFQQFMVCSLPTIYNPHDLQHLHYPEFFTPDEIAFRETVWRTGCRLAHTVAVTSDWVKDDVALQYGISPQKIQVIPWSPPTEAYPRPKPEVIKSVREQHRLPEFFAFYPAMTWEHKNHLRLLEAIAVLRDREGKRVHLVCTGHKNSFWPRIEERLHELRLEDQVQFLGVVSPEHLRALYHLAQFVIVPTLFEAASGPLFEAWQEMTPVACSTVTSLPEQASDAALLFDPMSVEAIVEAIARLSSDAELREDLKRRGASRLQDFSWERTAKAYRATYRRAAHRSLNDEDTRLLEWNWMRDPRR